MKNGSWAGYLFEHLLTRFCYNHYYALNNKSVCMTLCQWIPTLVYRIDVHARLSILRKKFPPARPYFGLHVYCFWEKKPCTFIFLHVYWYLPCTFINFEKKIPPCTALFGSAPLLILRNNSPLHVYSGHIKIQNKVIQVKNCLQFC